MFDYARGGYLMGMTTPSPDVVDDDDERTPEPGVAAENKAIPTRWMDESGQGPMKPQPQPKLSSGGPTNYKQHRKLLLQRASC